MDEDSGTKKTLKKKRTKVANKTNASNISKQFVEDSGESDDEIPDYGNGIDMSLAETESVLSDGGWSSDDDRELVTKVKSISKENDKVNYKTRLKQVNWGNIAFKNYSAEDCEKRFSDHLKHVRRHRNLNEISTDIEANIKKCPLKRPLNSYQIFVQDQLLNVTSSGDFAETMRNLANRYREMPAEEKIVYEHKAQQLLQEYKVKKQEFIATSGSGSISKPSKIASKAKTPFTLYVEDNPGESDYAKLREEYTNLSIDEKYKWVHKAVSLADGDTKFLNKEEQRIFKGQMKQSPSAYSLFVKDVYNKMKDQYDGKDLFREIAQRWKSLDAKKKKTYTDAAVILKEKTAKEQQEFNERHGVSPQKMKRRKSVYVERQPENKTDEENEMKEGIDSPKPKKRKLSASSGVDSSSDEVNAKPNLQISMKSLIKSSVKSKVKTPIKSPMKSPEKQIPLEVKSPIMSQERQTAVEVNSPKKSTEKPNLVEMKEIMQTPIEVKEKKKKKKLNSMSESSDMNDKGESDASSSTTSTSSKKKSKKEKKEKTVEPPSDRPPSTLFRYFAKHVHTGKPHKAAKAFDKLTKKERKQLNSEYNEKVESYTAQLQLYLSSLSKEDAVEYISKVKAAKDAEDEAQGDSSQEY